MQARGWTLSAKLRCQIRRDTRGSVSVPQWRDRDRALGVGPEPQAGHLQKRGLILDADVVGDEQACVLHQARKFQIAGGGGEMQSGEGLQFIEMSLL